jgi:hypothetical protein
VGRKSAKFWWPGSTFDSNFQTNRHRASNVGPFSSLTGFIAAIGGTLTRATPATYSDNDGILQTAAAGVPRLGTVPGLTTRLGYLAEEARQNAALWSRDLTNVAWVKVTATAAKDQTGLDGVASSASRLTATAGNGTCLQTVVLASSARFQSAYVKRLVGSGTIQMTTDGGTTWTTVTVTSAWTRVTIPTQTLIDPIFGFRIVTSGDSIAVDYVQNETGAFATSPIPTTTVAVPRNADVLSLPTAGWYSASAGTWYVEFTPLTALGAAASLFSANDATANNRFGAGVSALAAGVYNRVRSGGADYDSAAIVSALTPGAAYKTASAASVASGGANVLSGGTVSTATVTAMPVSIAALEIGCELSAAFANCLIHRLFYLPSRQEDAVIQGWTA